MNKKGIKGDKRGRKEKGEGRRKELRRGERERKRMKKKERGKEYKRIRRNADEGRKEVKVIVKRGVRNNKEWREEMEFCNIEEIRIKEKELED